MVYMNNTGQTLTRQQVIAIREQRAAGLKVEDIARGYGVSRNTISRIVNGQSHKIVQDIPFTPIPQTTAQKARVRERIITETKETDLRSIQGRPRVSGKEILPGHVGSTSQGQGILVATPQWHESIHEVLEPLIVLGLQ